MITEINNPSNYAIPSGQYYFTYDPDEMTIITNPNKSRGDGIFCQKLVISENLSELEKYIEDNDLDISEEEFATIYS